jgi:hypothetical protein
MKGILPSLVGSLGSSCRYKRFKQGNYLNFLLCSVINTASSVVPQIPLCRRMNPGQLRLRNCHSDALTTRLDLIHKRYLSCLGCAYQPSTKKKFPNRTLFHFMCVPIRPATWAGSRAGSPCRLICVSGKDGNDDSLCVKVGWETKTRINQRMTLSGKSTSYVLSRQYNAFLLFRSYKVI